MIEKIPVLTLTDDGRDVDDIEAIAYLQGSPSTYIAGIVTTHMIPDRRARIAREMMNHFHEFEVPIGVGSVFPIGKEDELLVKYLREHTIEGTTYEGDGLIECFPDGIELIHELIDKYGSELRIAVQAPLTDLAKAAQKDEKNFCKIGGLYIQGQATIDDGKLVPDFKAYNLAEDEEAANHVFSLQDKIAMTFVGKYAAYQVPFTRKDFEAFVATGHVVGEYLKTHAEKGLECFAKRAPKIFERVFGVSADKVDGLDALSNPYDVLVAKAVANPEGLKGIKVGKHTLIGMTEDDRGIESPEEVKADLMNTILKALRN